MNAKPVTTCRAAFLCVLLGAVMPSAATAEERRPLLPGYPAKPVRLLVAVLPGGGMDTVARAVAARMSEQLPVPVTVENVAGAAGTVAVNTVSAAAPDGHTLLGISGALHIRAAFRKYDYDVRSSLQAIQQMSYQPFVVIARLDAPFASMQELVAHAKRNPGKVTYGSSGLGSPIHMGTALIEHGAGIDMLHIPYKGGSAAQVDLLAGRLDMALSAISGLQLARAGKARVLGITAAQRHPDYPDVPTVAETVIPGYEVVNGYWLYAPAKTPAAIANALNRDVQRVLANDDLKKKLVADASMPGPARTPAEWQKAFVAEIARWEALVAKAGLKLED